MALILLKCSDKPYVKVLEHFFCKSKGLYSCKKIKERERYIMKSKLKGLVVLVSALVMTFMFSAMVMAATPEKVTDIKQTKDYTSSLGIKWNAVLGATKYEVQCSESATNFDQNVKTLESYTADELISGLSSGHSYYVRVRAVNRESLNKTEYGAWSDIVEVVTAPDYVKGAHQISATTNSAKIQWDASDGATSYKVYKLINGTESFVGETNSTSFEVKNIDKKVSFSLTVYSARSTSSYEAVTSSRGIVYSSDIKLVPAKVSNIYVSNVYPSIKILDLKWQADTYANGYQIEVYKNNAKKPFLKTSSNSASYSLNNATSKSFYMTRIRAYTVINGKTEYGAWSDYKCFGQQVNVNLKRSGSKNIKITWSKMAGAKSYSVYVSTSKTKGYKKVATTKKRTYTLKKYKKKSLKKNKKYYIYVVANGKKGKKKFTSSVGYYYYLF